MMMGLSLLSDQVLDAPAPIGLADAVEAGIGFDLDEVPVPGAADDHALDVGDLDLLAQRGGEAVEGRGQPEGGGRMEETAAVHGTERTTICGER